MIKDIWLVIHSALHLIKITRFSFIIVLLAALALYFNKQVQDLLVGAGENAFTMSLFILAVVWWSLQSWGWARYILQKQYGDDRGQSGHERWLINHIPRIYGFLSTLVATVAAYMAGATEMIPFLVVILIAMYFFYLKRRVLISKLPSISKLDFLRGRVRYITYFVMLILSAYAVIDPVSMGFQMGAGAVTFFGLGSLIPVGTLLVYKSIDINLPVLSIIAIFIALFSLSNDNHQVRTLDKNARQGLSLQQAYARWAELNQNNEPLVVVTTAGGGLRASYWTGVVLGQLEEDIPSFHKYLFAISGVSGGSLGAVMYSAALHSRETNQADGFSEKLLASMSRDYLGPTVTAMLFGDLFQRFLPVAVFDDRAKALEQGWEQGFKRAYNNENIFSLNRPFRDLFNISAENQWSPILLLNGTSEETGKRIITSHLKINDAIFYDSYDFYDLNGNKAIAASTAAHNSARFSYVSPAGTLNQESGLSGHIIDGGYFENYGATTLSNLLTGLGKTNFYTSGRKLIIIVISNDTEISREEYDDGKMMSEDGITGQRFLNEIAAPLKGMLSVRGAHGFYAFKELKKRIGMIKGEHKEMGDVIFSHFSIKKTTEGNPPLGWVLSKKSRENMRQQIDNVSYNCKELLEICVALSCTKQRTCPK